MSNELQGSVISHSSRHSDLLKHNSTSSIKSKGCESLFSCFKLLRKKKLDHSLTNYDCKEYDYIVEKLIVNRAPFVFFTIPKRILKNKGDTYAKDIEKTLITAATDTMFPNTLESQTLLCNVNSNQIIIPIKTPIKSIQNDDNIAVLNEKNPYILSTNYNGKGNKLMNTMHILHSNLTEYEVPSKDLDSLSKHKISLSKNITEIASIKKSLIQNNQSQVQEVFKPFSIVSPQELSLIKKGSKIDSTLTNFEKLDLSSMSAELKNLRSEIISENELKMWNLKQTQDMCLNNYQNDNVYKNAEDLIVQPIEDMFYSLKDFKKTIIDSNQLNAEDYYRENTKIKLQTNSIFQYNQQSLTNKSQMFVAHFKNMNPSNPKLKWKIIVRFCNSKTTKDS